MPHSEVWGMEKIMENKVFKLIFGGIAIIIIIVILFFIFLVHNEVDSIVATIKENNDNIEITCDCIDKINILAILILCDIKSIHLLKSFFKILRIL